MTGLFECCAILISFKIVVLVVVVLKKYHNFEKKWGLCNCLLKNNELNFNIIYWTKSQVNNFSDFAEFGDFWKFLAPLCCEYPLLISVMFVLVPPEWIVKPHDMEAVEGQDVFFPCRVSGVPEPSIIWRKLAGKQSSSVHTAQWWILSIFCLA